MAPQSLISHVDIKNLRVQLGDKTVLNGINFSLSRGDFVSVVGRSGVGKTTLLHAIAGFIDYSGKIIKPPKTGIVFQQNSVFPWMTVSDNILFGLNTVSLEINNAVLNHYLELTRMRSHANRYCFELSGGEMQRVAIARAFAPQPELVLMDEPFGALDVHTRGEMQHWLRTVWNTDKKTVIFVTHSIEEALLLSNRIVVLTSSGSLVEYPIPQSFLESDRSSADPIFLRMKEEILKIM